MVEVFKTDVSTEAAAKSLLAQIHQTFDEYKANFDLDDCDQILRIECEAFEIPPQPIIELLMYNGFCAEVLKD